MAKYVRKSMQTYTYTWINGSANIFLVHLIVGATSFLLHCACNTVRYHTERVHWNCSHRQMSRRFAIEYFRFADGVYYYASLCKKFKSLFAVGVWKRGRKRRAQSASSQKSMSCGSDGRWDAERARACGHRRKKTWSFSISCCVVNCWFIAQKLCNGAKVTESNALLPVIFHYWPLTHTHTQNRYCNLHFTKIAVRCIAEHPLCVAPDWNHSFAGWFG